MSIPLRLRELRIHRLRIPLRLRFEHAAAVRDTADPIIVSIAAAAPHAHVLGYGETLARPYVTGETPGSVVDDISHVFAPLLADFQVSSFFEVLETLESLPLQVGGRVVTAARCAVELALLDLGGRIYHRRPVEAVGWLGLPGFGPPGCLRSARYSGMVVGRTRGRLQRALRLQRLAGLRDFKLKIATEGWQDRLRWAYEVLRGPLARGRATLRVDANAGWSLADAVTALPLLEKHGVCAVEQPLPETQDADLPYLATQSGCDLVVDESLITPDDAERLIAAGDGVAVFNLRLAKNGGLLPALRMARLALSAGRDVQLGCLVGETSILSAAGVAFLEACPKVRFVEGAYGRWLLRQDVTRRPVRFGCGGRISRRKGVGLGVDVDPARVEALAAERPRVLAL